MLSYMLSVSFLIAGLLFLRALLRRWISPRLMYALWLVVVLRLCLPGTVIALDLALPQSAPTETEAQGARETAAAPAPAVTDSAPQTAAPAASELPAPLTAAPATDAEPTPLLPIAPSESAAPVLSAPPTTLPAAAEPPREIDLARLARIVWLCGSLALALWFGGTWLRFVSRLHRDRTPHGRLGRVRVWVSPSAGTPCLCGPIPAIYLTPETAETPALPLVLCHEQTHLRHGDPLWAAVRTAALIVFWWNPLIWAAAFASRQDGELACDEAVTARLTAAQRLTYARVIVDTLPRRRPALTFGAEPVKERILMLTGGWKHRAAAAVLAILLTLTAVGCSLVGRKPAETDGNGGQNDINDTTVTPDDTTRSTSVGSTLGEGIRIVGNAGGLTFCRATLPADSANDFDFDETRRLILAKPREGESAYRLYLFDPAAGGFIASATLNCSRPLSEVAYTDDGCILYHSDLLADGSTYVVTEAYAIGYADGVLTARAVDDYEILPQNGAYVCSPDGTWRAYAVKTDLSGRGYLALFSDLWGRRIVERNVIYADAAGGGDERLSNVRTYYPVAFLDNTHLLYRIFGYEGTKGCAVYDTTTDTSTPVEAIGYSAYARLFAVRGSDWFILYPTVDGNVREIWRYSLDGDAMRVAGYTEQTREGVLQLPPEEYSTTYYTDEALLIADTVSIAGMSAEEREQSAATVPMRIYTLENMAQTAELEIAVSLLARDPEIYTCGNTVTFLFCDPNAPEPALVSPQASASAAPTFDPAPRMVTDKGYIDFVQDTAKLGFSVIGLPTQYPNTLRYAYDDYGRYEMLLTAIPAKRSEANQEVLAWRDQHLYLYDRQGDMIAAHTAVPGDIRLSNVTYTDDGPILYALGGGNNDAERRVTAAYAVRYGSDGLILTERSDLIGLPTVAAEGEGSLYPIREAGLYSPDGRWHVYKTIDDPNLHGGIDLVASDGTVKRIFTTVQLGDLLPDGREAGLGDVIGYLPVAFLDNTRLVYQRTGWEWSSGFGIYNVETGENTVLARGGFGVLGVSDGVIYADEGSIYGYATAAIWAYTPDGQRTKLVAIPEEQQQNESHASYRFHDDMWLVVEQLDGDLLRFTAKTLDLKTELAAFTVRRSLYTGNSVRIYTRANAITAILSVSP